MVMQIRRTSTPNKAPNNLAPGQLAVEMASDPPRLWVGVPNTVDATRQRVLTGRRPDGGIGGFMTGDVKFTFKDVVDPGFVLCDDGTIGNANSGATTADDDCKALFTLLFDDFNDATVPLFQSDGTATTRGAQGTAANAWSNDCRIALTRIFGRALAVAGQGGGLTNRPLGAIAGAESTAFSTAENAVHFHTPNGQNFVGVSDPTIPCTYTDPNPQYAIISYSVTTAGAGSSAPHSNMQPTAFLNVMISL